MKRERGSWRRQLQRWWWCGGNLTQSCVLGMTSLGGPVEVRCLGIAFAPGIGGRYGAEAETGMSTESLFYLACDGEIQINSCQSGGPQGEGLRRWGRMRLRVGGKGEIWWKSDGRWGWRGQGLTDGVSVNPGFLHRFITSNPGSHRVGICISRNQNYLKIKVKNPILLLPICKLQQYYGCILFLLACMLLHLTAPEASEVG